MLAALLPVVLCVLCERAVLPWYSRIETNATFDVGCKSEETAVSWIKGSICIRSQHSLCKIPSLALGVKTFIIVICEASEGAFFTSFVHYRLVITCRYTRGLFPVAFPVTFPLPGFAASKAFCQHPL
jgi:hypothetical protein